MNRPLLLLFLFLFHPPADAASEALKQAILMCESSDMHYEPKKLRGKQNPRAGMVRWGDDGISRGIAQFRKETFYEQAADAKKEGKWPFGKPRWFSEKQQLWLLDYMLDKGLGNRWTCYRTLTRPMD